MSRQLFKFPYVSPEMLSYFPEIVREDFTGFAVVNRASIIENGLITFFLEIYNGIRFYMLLVANDSVGHILGEFSPTRKKPVNPLKTLKLKKKKK